MIKGVKSNACARNILSIVWKKDQFFSRINQGCRVRSRISDLSKICDSRLWPFQNFRLWLFNIKGMKFGFQNQWKSWCTLKNCGFNENFKINYTISTAIHNLGVWCKKWSNWAVGVGQKNPTPTPSVVRNLTPPTNLQLFMTPAPDSATLVWTKYLIWNNISIESKLGRNILFTHKYLHMVCYIFSCFICQNLLCFLTACWNRLP